MLSANLSRYKRKYYLNALLKGSISVLAIILSSFYFINIVEYLGNFDTLPRAILFYFFLLIVIGSFYFWIVSPLYHFFNKKRQITDTEAARRIGAFFPEIGDKLLNTLQLQSIRSDSDLVTASLAQRESSVAQYEFSQAVDLNSNRKYIKYLIIPFLAILATLLLSPQLFTETTPRIINYTKKYEPKAPFSFIIGNNELKAFKNEDFELNLNLSGSAVPQNVQIVTSDKRRLKMASSTPGDFAFTFKKIQHAFSFHFEASGFKSATYDLKVFTRPSLRSFSVFLDYPEYVGKNDERVENTGNLIVPEGTQIEWQFNTLEANELSLKFLNEDTAYTADNDKESVYTFNKTIAQSETYQVALKNQYSDNKDIIEYYLNVTPDEFPTINIRQYEDTVLFDYLLLGGNIGDDYGITDLRFKYRMLEEQANNSQPFKSIKLAFNKNAINQSYFHQLSLASLEMGNGNRLEYFVEVWDNDAVNGRKSSKTRTFKFTLPSNEEIRDSIEKDTKKTENQIEETLNKSEELKKEIEDIQDKLKGKRKLDWQDKKAIEKLIEKNDQLKKDVEKLKQLNQLFNEKKDKFNLQSKELSEKAEQLQKLMDELLDEETKKLYDELNKLLEQNFINQDFQETMDQIEMKEETLKKELERALELFKQLKFESKAEQIAQQLEELSEEQEELSDETKDAEDSELENLGEKQDELNEKFDDVEKEMEELQEINESLENQKDLQPFEQQQENINQEQQNAKEQLQEGEQKKASDSQKKSSQQMQQMAQQMQQMQQSMQMQELTENYDDLRKILENLIKLSFDQEKLMLDFQKVKRIDPRFIELGQEQLKLKDDARIIEDSLTALSKRVFQIESFVTREVASMNNYMDESLEFIKKRTPEIAASKQQFAMTSINNLALLLNDILKQMQQQMSMAMSGKQNSEKQNGSPSLSELQKQLNQKIQQLKKSGKSGRELSEELAKLAAEQEMIRNAMKNGMGKGDMNGKKGKGEKEGEGEQGMEGDEGNDGNNGYKELLEEMENSEEDLVNKRLTQELIQRQKKILTRLLESEKAEKERELDNEREAKTAEQDLKKNTPDNFSEYLKLKEMQIELLKTIPTSLNQYYKKQVNEYFKKIKE